MQTNVRLIQKRRVFSIEFKQKLVKLFEEGTYSVNQLQKLYGVGFVTIYRWIYTYSSFNEKGCRIVEMKQSSTTKIKALEERIKELEQSIGQKQIKIDFLEKMIDIAGQELNIDIKKKSSTPQSTGSGKGARS